MIATVILANAAQGTARAAFPGRNGEIAFSTGACGVCPSNPTYDLQVFAIRPDGSGLRQLTTGQFNIDPAWSPDGRWVAFFNGGAQIAHSNVQLVGDDGNLQHPLPGAFPLGSGSPGWSPDGRHIALATTQGIAVADPLLGIPIQIEYGQGVGPAWSPDGTKIAFVRKQTCATCFFFDIYVMNSDGSNVRFLTSGLSPNWSPDGSRLVYTDLAVPPGGGSSPQLFTIKPGGDGKVQLTSDFTAVPVDPAWSPDGKQIVYINEGQLWLMNADGSNQHHLPSAIETLDPSAGVHKPDWQPLP